MVRFRYVSDLHLEFNGTSDLVPDPEAILLLLGDIAHLGSNVYNNFISNCSNDFKAVIVIFGNHEFYEREINYPRPEFPENVHLLENGAVYVNGKDSTVTRNKVNADCVKVIGSTLWSNVSNYAATKLNDFYCIKDFTPDDYRRLFRESRDYILTEIQKDPEISVILMTHHGVHPICNGKYTGNAMSSAFATLIPELYIQPNLRVCIGGHTHECISTFIPETNIFLLSNCRGYPDEQTGYNPMKTLTVKKSKFFYTN